ncbi:MAG: methylated-DNA--[protein]-cysteine S-methyltransferase [Candidatus Nanohaloarchaea archaeon]
MSTGIEALPRIEMPRLEQDEDAVRKQLHEYLEGERRSFELDYRLPDGFPGAVLEEVEKIGYGETVTYGEIAEELDTAAVAVGQACGRNPIPVIVPCHRVVSSNGLGGYKAELSIKRKRLELESRNAAS